MLNNNFYLINNLYFFSIINKNEASRFTLFVYNLTYKFLAKRLLYA